MAILSKLLVALGLDATDYQRGFDTVKKATSGGIGKIGSTLESIGKEAQKMGGMLSLGVTTPLVAMGVKAVGAASDLEESMNKVNVVFGDSAAGVVTFSETAATALGQSQQQALEAAGTYGNLFTAMGIGVDTSADMSTSLVTLAGDLASFNNAIPEEALIALRAGLVGETEPLKRFGVNLNAAAIAAKAMELGLTDVSVDLTKVQGLTLDLEKAQAKAASAMEQYGADSIQARDAAQAVAEVQSKLNEALAGSVEQLTPAQKAQAAYAIIMEQTTTAQGDFARTADGLANSTRIMKAQLADAAATMGSQLLPVGLQIVSFVNNLIGRFRELSPQTQKVILIVAGLAAAIGPVLVVLGTLASSIGTLIGAFSAVAPVLGGVVAVIGGPVLAVIAAVAAAVGLLWTAWSNNWFGIRDTLTAVWEGTLKPALEALWNWIQTTIPVALEWLANVWTNILKPAIEAVWSFLQEYVFPVFGALINVWLALVKKELEFLAAIWTNVLKPAIEAVWSFLQDYVFPLLEALAKVVIALVKKELELLAAIWTNVLKPALEAVWSFIQNSVIPIFEAVIDVVRGPLGDALQWLVEHVLEPARDAFQALVGVIKRVIDWLHDLADAISGIHMPSWLDGGGELGGSIQQVIGYVGDLQAAIDDLTWATLGAGPALGPAISAPAYAGTAKALEEIRPVATVAPGAVAGPSGGGDTFIIHNHDQLATAINHAWVEEHRRRRLNQTMGA